MTRHPGNVGGQEPHHRKEKTLKQRIKHKVIPTNLVKSTCDANFRLDIIELETKLLNLKLLTAEFEKLNLVNKKLLYGDTVTEGTSDPGEEENEIESEDGISNELPDRDVEKLNNKFEVKEFNVAIMNPGGMNSKRESIINAVHNQDIRALVVSETHTVGKEVPVLDRTMEAFFTNRGSGQNKGGVSIFLEKTLAKHSVVVGKSSPNSDHEWIAVKINYFDPPVVLIGVYGCQTSKNKVSELKQKWEDLWDFVSQYTENNTVILGGDLNSAIGRSQGMSRNCPSTNANGKFLVKGVKKLGLTILNKFYHGDQRTHKDRSSDSFRCLDYILTNKKDQCSRVFVDNNLVITPYRVMSGTIGNPQGVRRFTDHKTVLSTFHLQKRGTVKVTPPPPIIVRNEEGDAKFRLYTEQVAELALEKLNSGTNILNVLKLIMRKVSEAERLAYTRIVVTSVKRKMWSDNEAFLKLTRDLESQAERIMKCNTNDKIFKMRSQKLQKERHEEASAMFNDRGEIVEDRESILQVLTQYNKKLLSRVPHSVDFEEIHRMKKAVVDTLDNTKVEEFNTISPRDYLRAIQRITNKGKNMFKNFLNLHPKLQAVFFFVFKQMYEEEVVPDDFVITFLISLHKKNDKRDPGNYRFLHMRSDLSRIYELLVYLKLETHFDRFTAESQMGGRKNGDTVEHLMMLTSIIKAREEEENTITSLIAVDSVKCFDRSWLSDNHAVLQMEGADRKAVKMMYKLQKKNVINVAGSKESFIIEDGVGQGSVGGARITTSAITESTERNLNKLPRSLTLLHRQVPVPQQGFVDDVILINGCGDGARASSKLYSNSLSELAMSAHPVKSVQIIAGPPDKIEEFKEEMRKEPCQMQGFDLKLATSEKYLGMWFVSGPYQETVNKNIKVKHGLMQAVATEIRNMCEIPEIKRFGKSAAQKLLIQSQLVPVCLYSTQAWIDIQPDQYEALEMSFKEAITTVMSVPKGTTYAALLKVNNLLYIEHFLDMVKLKMWNFKLNCKKSGRAYHVLLEEIVSQTPGGMAADLANLSKKYGLKNICLGQVSPEVIRKACRQASYRRQWREHLVVRHIPMMITSDKVRHTWHELPYNLARGLILKDLGLLVTKDQCPHLFLERNMAGPKDRNCLFWPRCQERDSYRHLISGECPYYSTRLKVTGDPVLDEGVFIDQISRERGRVFTQPMVTFGGSDFGVYDEILDDPAINANNNMSDKIIASLCTKHERKDASVTWACNPPVKYIYKSVRKLVNICVSQIWDTGVGDESDSSDQPLWWRGHTAGSAHCRVANTPRLLTGQQNPKTTAMQKALTKIGFVSSVQKALSVTGSRIRSINEYSYCDQMATVNGEEKEIMGNSSIELHTCEVTVAMGAGGRSISNIRVSTKEEDGRITRSNFVLKQDQHVDKAGMSTGYSIEITRKGVTFGVKKCITKPDSAESPETSEVDTEPEEEGNNEAEQNLIDSSEMEEEDSGSFNEDESTTMSTDTNGAKQGGIKCEVTVADLISILEAPESETEEEKGEQSDRDADTGRQQSTFEEMWTLT